MTKDRKGDVLGGEYMCVELPESESRVRTGR